MMKVGLIGSGRIAPFYIQVLQNLGAEIFIASSLNSQSAKKLASDYNLTFVDNSYDLVSSNIHFLIVACDTKFAVDYLMAAQKNTKIQRILVEKPVFISVTILEASSLTRNNIYVAYNRRFYASVARFKLCLGNIQSKRLINITAPEKYSQHRKFFALESNGVHLIDLVDHLVSGIQTYEILSRYQDENRYLDLQLKFMGYRHDAIVHWRFGANLNTTCSFDDDSVTYELKPVERFAKFHHMKIIEASALGGKVIRNYQPIIDESSIVDDRALDFKPGFAAMIECFLTSSHVKTQFQSIAGAKKIFNIMSDIVSHLNQ